MARSVFSQSWHNVANLRPRILSHTRIYSQVYRGQHWYIVQDPTGSRYHRLTPQAHALVSRMDGTRTIQQLWDGACAAGGDDLPTQDEVVELLMQLHAQDLLHCDVTPDSAELLERYRKNRNKKWKQSLLNPMSIRIPLLDPDAFLTYWRNRIAWLFGRLGLILWLAVVIPAMFLAGQHWNELTENLSDRVLSGSNLLLMALIFPIIKALHELGHGFATKVWGGAVHEMGVMLLVFAPLPYVEASASSAFRSKYQRAVVGAAGMLVEVFLASVAMYVWLWVEPGLVRAIAFNTMLIAGISTVIVNGNPLLRYDGYYILADLIEIPNLAQRGQRYLTYLCDRYLFGAREIEPPRETPAEKRWLVGYTILSWFYRMFVMITIILFVATQFFFIGVLLAIWGAITLLVIPIGKGIKHILTSPPLQRHRGRAVKVTAGAVLLTSLSASAIPLPLHTQAEGVVWLPDQAQIRSGTNGFFQQWLVAPGSRVRRGTPLLVMTNPELAAEMKAAQAKVSEAEVRYRVDQFENPAEAAVTLQQLEHERRALDRIKEKYSRLVVRSGADGVLTVADASDMQGRYYKKGELLGYVLEREQLIARVAVTQDDIDLVRSHLSMTELRFAEAAIQIYPVTLLREVPSGLDQLPSSALSLQGGGKIPVDPQDPEGLKTLERVFLFDVSLPEKVASAFGGRVHVRFTHQSEPLVTQAFRRIRQLFLSHFHV